MTVNAIDLDAITEALSRKADIDLVNCTQDQMTTVSKEYFAGLSLPSIRFVNLTLGTSGNTYTAPANGWFNALYHSTASSGTNSTLDLKNRTTGITCVSKEYSSSSQVITALIPARKGDVVRLNYEGLSATDTDYFRFIYAEGEK